MKYIPHKKNINATRFKPSHTIQGQTNKVDPFSSTSWMIQFLMRTFFSRLPNGKRRNNPRPVLATRSRSQRRSSSSRTAPAPKFRPVSFPHLRRRIFPSHRRIRGFDPVRKARAAKVMSVPKYDRGESRKIKSEWNGSNKSVFISTGEKYSQQNKPKAK